MDNPQSIPFVAYESACTRIERTNKRLFILCILLLIALIATNAGWIYYESQFQVVETTDTEVSQEADGNGRNFFVGGDFGVKSDN